jgi:hypothetical protein
MRNFIIFLALNFLALAIGGQFTGNGVASEWYQTIKKPLGHLRVGFLGPLGPLL